MADQVRTMRRLSLALIGGTVLPALLAVPGAAQEVVQALPNPASAELNEALQRLSRDPGSVSALVDAGRASLALNDVDAALGFYNRAQARAPEDGAVLAGLGQVAVRRGEAATALQLFTNAENAGFRMASVAGERGLAYDLAGQNAQAQRLYRQSLGDADDDEVTRRLALSYAMAGDGAASEAALLPLLQRQDRAAFRARAFALAILGQSEEAVTIAETLLPARLATRLEPYLRYMPQLTRAQQAAAVNLGQFPAASDIGRDDPRLAALGIDQPAASVRGGPDARLIPGGEPLGEASAAPPVVMVELPAAELAVAAELPPVAELPPAAVPQPPVVVAVLEAPPAPVIEPPAVALALEEPSAPVIAPPVVVAVLEEPAAPIAVVAEPPIAVLAIATPPEPVVDPRPAFSISEPEPEPQVDLAEAFAEFAAGDSLLPSAPAPGAVDITAIVPARERPPPSPPPPPPPPPSPPPPPAHPARHWVQVATGQDTAAFRFDWRRIRREAEGLLDNRQPFQSRWGQSNRLVTGPFPTAAAANAFVTQLNAKGVESFRFSSAAGEEVRPVQ